MQWAEKAYWTTIGPKPTVLPIGLSSLRPKCLSLYPPQCLILSVPIPFFFLLITQSPNPLLLSSPSFLPGPHSRDLQSPSPQSFTLIAHHYLYYATTQTSSHSVLNTCLLTSKGHHFLRPQELFISSAL